MRPTTALLMLLATTGATALRLAAPFAAAGSNASNGPPTPCLASTYGATPSTTRYATAALQAAIDDCAGRCGTMVLDAPGAYLTASLLLTGCVHLALPAGVTLLAGTERADYGPNQPEWYLLHFHSCSSCGLSGGGTVDGRARLWVVPEGQQQSPKQQGEQPQAQLQSEHLPPPDMPRKAVRNWRDPSCSRPTECRPRLVGVVDSSNISISGVTLKDPVYWCLHVLRSQNVRISDVRIWGDWGIPNNDGIDVDGSRRVSITGADVATGDDAICLKTTTPGAPLEDVTVTNCTLRSLSSAVKLGTESLADMRRLSFARLAIEDSHRGLAIQLRDGGNISSVRFEASSITTRHYAADWWGAAEPIYVTAVPRTPGAQVGMVSNVVFANIYVAASENGIFLAGGPLLGRSSNSSARTDEHAAAEQLPGLLLQQQHTLHGIIIDRVRLRLQKLTNVAGGCQDYRPSSNTSLGAQPLPASSSGSTDGSGGSWWPAGLDCSSDSTAAVWVAGADGVLLSDVKVYYGCPRRADWRQLLHFDAASTTGVQLAGMSVTADSCE